MMHGGPVVRAPCAATATAPEKDPSEEKVHVVLTL